MKTIKNTEFSLTREATGLSIKQVAEILGKTERTIYRWEAGETLSDPKSMVLLQAIAEQKIKKRPISPPAFRFIDLFAGIGGLRRAFESVGGKCVFTSEWDLSCRKTYLANYVCDHPIKGDITKVELNEIDEDIDVLLAGFPCQPFSIAGVSKKNSLGRAHGFLDETQGTLFFDVARIIKVRRPKAFLLENVKNLQSHDNGNTFRTILRVLEDELKYHVKFKVIDARPFVPQHRERIFIVGFAEETSFSFDDLVLPDNRPTLGSILHPENGTEIAESPYTEGPHAKVSEKYTLSNGLWKYLREYKEKHTAKGNGFGYGLFGEEDVARTLSARYYKDGSEILVKQGKDENPRKLTPRECARLMGFDKLGCSEDEKFKLVVSDTQAYKQFGNSVAVPVVEAIARLMRPSIEKAIEKRKLPEQIEWIPEYV
jgi:DNA (cytosine-5)-methyltransferase 1